VIKKYTYTSFLTIESQQAISIRAGISPAHHSSSGDKGWEVILTSAYQAIEGMINSTMTNGRNYDNTFQS